MLDRNRVLARNTKKKIERKLRVVLYLVLRVQIKTNFQETKDKRS